MADRISVRPTHPRNSALKPLYGIYEGDRRAPGTRNFIHEKAMDMAQKYAYTRLLGYHPEGAAYVAACMMHAQTIARQA